MAVNLDVAGKLALEKKAEPHLAHGYAERALAHVDKIDHWWVLQELLWREATVFRSGAPELMEDSAAKALTLYAQHPVVLEPVLDEGGPRPTSPFDHLARLGIDPVRVMLQERQVRLAPEVTAVPLVVDLQQLNQIVKVIVDG